MSISICAPHVLKYVVLVGISLASVIVVAQVQERRLREFRDIFKTAGRLESAGMQVASDGDPRLLAERKELLFAFAREPKGAVTDRNYQQLTKLVNDYRIKAYQYVQDCRKQNNNWFTKIISFGGALGAMKGLSRSDDYLTGVTERYESQGRTGQLSDEIVNQDMAKFQIRGIDMIMFVLAADIKYLAIENVQILNTAINQQLQADKFVANNNFYEVDTLTSAQKKLLLDYYASRVDANNVSIGEASEHIEPSNLIIGRLLDSCHSVQDYKLEWTKLLPVCGDDCKSETLFSNKYNLDRYEDVVQFCERFLDAL